MQINLRLSVYLLIILILNYRAQAQYENVWTFGGGGGGSSVYPIGLDFNSGTPSPFATVLDASMGSASVCDDMGNLLFYTEGSYIITRGCDTMPNGHNLTQLSLPTTSWGATTNTSQAGQSSMIVPMPDSPGLYYVFSLTSEHVNDYNDYGKLYYSIVDMKLNNGYGDVVQGRKGILLDSNLSEHLTGVVGDRCNVWVLANSRNGDIKAYEITSEGINTDPVISAGIGPEILSYFTTYPFLKGIMSISPNRKKLVITVTGALSFFGDYGNTNPVTLYDFDPASGIVSNPLALLAISDTLFGYGACFSPDNSKLYTHEAGWSEGDIFQYDLSSGITNDIVNSRYRVGTTDHAQVIQIKCGPDGRLYFPYQSGIYLGTISAPNLKGAACQFLGPSIQLWGTQVPLCLPAATTPVPIGSWFYGLPNTVPVYKKETRITSNISNGSCTENVFTLHPKDISGWDYTWNNGALDTTITIEKEGGLFWVSYYTPPCNFHVDTFHVTPWEPLKIDLGADTIICGKDFLINLPGMPEGTVFKWNDGSRDNKLLASQSGKYWVEATLGICKETDTINIIIKDLQQDLGPDTSFCKGESIVINLTSRNPEEGEVLWSNGERNPSIRVTDTGLYWVSVSYPPCEGTDSINIIINYCDCIVNMPNAFSPNGDGINDVFLPVFEPQCPIRNYALHVYNRLGQKVFSSNNPEMGWNGYYRSKPGEVGVYFYEVNFNAGTKGIQRYIKGDLTLIK